MIIIWNGMDVVLKILINGIMMMIIMVITNMIIMMMMIRDMRAG